MATKEIVVIGGPNGAGKSTLAAHILPVDLQVVPFVNADWIAKGISPHDPDSAAFEAGRIMITRLREFRAAGESFAFESTLASRTFAPFLREAAERGYLIHLVYVLLREPDQSVQRVSLRVRRGGHAIPEDVIRRRYTRSQRNFLELYRPISDGWSLWYNGDSEPRIIASARTGSPPTVDDHEIWNQLNDA